MISLKVRAKKWGNSLGIRIPKNAGVKPDEEVDVHIEKSKGFTKVKDIFGTFKFKRPTEEMLREVDQELEPE